MNNGFHAGAQWAWTGFILPWHAVASVMLPIAFAHRVAGGAAERLWLAVKAVWALTLLLSCLFSWSGMISAHPHMIAVDVLAFALLSWMLVWGKGAAA